MSEPAAPPSAPRARTASRRRAPLAASPRRVAALFATLEARDPDPRPELEYRDAFTLLVAVVLSAQATDAGVNKATRGLFAAAPTPGAMAALGEGAVREAIRSLGLFRNKARNVAELARLLVERHGGEVPRDRDALEALPGVGRKTANVVLNTVWGEPVIAVDTHIFRVGNRTGLAPGKTPREVEDALMRVVPRRYLKGAHHWLILHGRHVCRARKPDCAVCPIAAFCDYEPKTPAPLPPAERGAGDAP